MAFHPFEVNVPHLAYTIIGGFVVIFGMFSLGESASIPLNPFLRLLMFQSSKRGCTSVKPQSLPS